MKANETSKAQLMSKNQSLQVSLHKFPVQAIRRQSMLEAGKQGSA